MLYGGTVEELWAFIAANDEIAYDTETTGLNVRSDSIIGYSVGNGNVGFYVCTLRRDAVTGELVPTGGHSLALQILTALKTKKLWMWNAGFDLAITKNYFGVDLSEALHVEGQLLLHTIDENRFNYKLKEVAAEVFGDQVKDEQADMLASIKANGGSKGEVSKADTDLVAKYAIQDAVLTFCLVHHFLKQLKREGLEKFYFNDEVMPLFRYVTLPMEARGIRIDLERIRAAQTAIKTDLEALENAIQQAIEPHLGPWKTWFMNKDYPPSRTGEFVQAYTRLNKLCLPVTGAGKFSLAAAAIEALPDGHPKAVLQQKERYTEQEIEAVQNQLWFEAGKPGFNLSSTHHLKRLFMDALGEEPLSKTKTGLPQLDDDFLAAMAIKYSFAANMQTHRRLLKLSSTYMDRFIDGAEGDRFFARYKQFGTVTGRYSGDFQQLPRPIEAGADLEVIRKHTNEIRNFFIADEGSVLIDADYESLEPHVFAHISNDPAVISVFTQGHDFYSTVAIATEELEGFSADKKAPNYLGKADKAKRQSAKAYALGIAYGEEDFKLHHELGISQDEAKRLIAGYWAGFPILKKTSDAGKEHILAKGWIASEVGRRRRLGEAKEIADKHGLGILDSLQLWKRHHDTPVVYERMKKARRKLKKSLNAAINFPTQSLASSIVNRAAVVVNKKYLELGLNAVIVGQIHDEILVSASKSDASEAAKWLQWGMENAYKLSVPLKAEPIIGTRYGEIK